MKKIILKIFLLNVVAVLLISCEKDETLATASSNPTSAVLAANKTTLVLTKATLADTVETLTITAADFGFESGTTNTVEFAVKGTNFATVKSTTLTSTGAKTITKKYTTKELNDIMLSLNLPTGVASDMEVRVVSKISDKIASVKSNVVSLKITPFALVAFVYALGDYQGWTHLTADSLMSETGNGIYIGVVDFSVKPTGSLEYLITPAKNWNNKYADGGTGKLLYNGNNNLKAPAVNSYKIITNTNALTIAYEKYSFGIIGDATPTGWDSDTNMKYNNGTQEWSVTIALIGGKNIKFRLNDDWATNYGGSNGTLASGGADIAVATSGTYKVTFSIAKSTYSLVKQ